MSSFNSNLYFIASVAVIGITLNTVENMVLGCDNNSTFNGLINAFVSVVKPTEPVICASNLATKLEISVSPRPSVGQENHRDRHKKKNFLKVCENCAGTNTMVAVGDSLTETLHTAKLSSKNNYCQGFCLSNDESTGERTAKFSMDSGRLLNGNTNSEINNVEKYNLFRRSELYRDSSGLFIRHLDDAMELIDAILNELPLEKIAVSFNGGKDCTVLLHLFRIAIDRKFGTKKRIQAIYINCHDSFPEISSFISETCGRYQIDLFEYPGPIKDGLQKLKENHPDISAIIMGSRSTDPHGIHMKSKRQWTDKGWPSYLRVFPIFDWSYSDVWHAIIGLRVQYCSLYDQGYTSLGDKRKTGKNDALKILDENGKVIGYRPAYELNIGSLERLGRKCTES